MSRRQAAVLLALVLAVVQPAAASDGDSAAASDSAPASASASDSGPLTRLLRRLPLPRPFLPPLPRCHRFAGIRPQLCDGPRRVPMPTFAAAERAARLGLGTHEAADQLVLRAPPPEWVAEVTSSPPRDLLWPVAHGLLSRRFGVERVRATSRGSHPGVDIVAAEGALLRAVADGLVAYADNGVRGMGNALFLVHADASVSIYAHCRALHVSAGELVRRGQVVGELGRTGLTFRAHLHYEWRVAGRPRDPFPRFVERPEESLRIESADGEVSWRPPPPNRRADTAEPAPDASVY